MAKSKPNKARNRTAGTMRSVRESWAIEKWYKKKLKAFVDSLANSFEWWVGAEYKRQQRAFVGDQSPQAALEARINSVFRDWNKKIDEFAETVSADFAKRVDSYTTRSFLQAAQDANFTIRIQNNRKVNTIYQALVKENVGLITKLGRDHMQKAAGIVWRGVTNGRDRGYLEAEFQKLLGVTERDAARIALDQANKGTQALVEARAEAAGLIFGVWQHNSGGSKTFRDGVVSKEDHVSLDGRIYVLAEGLVDTPGGTEKVVPAQRINCFPGTSYLNASPFIQKLYRRLFSGKLSIIKTDDGTVLEATPNHPILTAKGWKPIGLLNDSDYVWQAPLNGIGGVKFDQNWMVPTLKQLFNAFQNAGAPKFNATTGDFHGDISDGDIDIIDVDSLLRDVSYSGIIQCAADFKFTSADVVEIGRLLSGKSDFDTFIQRCDPASTAQISGFCERLSGFLCAISVSEICSLATSSNWNIDGLQVTANNRSAGIEVFGNSLFALAGIIHGFDNVTRECFLKGSRVARWNEINFPQLFAQNTLMDADGLSGVLNQHSTSYKLSRVVEIGNRDFAGHVYNLQTLSGSYITQNTVVSNCKCSSRIVLPGTDLWYEALALFPEYAK